MDITTDSLILFGLIIILPLLLFFELQIDSGISPYPVFRISFSIAASVILILSFIFSFIKRNLHHLVTAAIYVFMSHAIFLNYVNNFSYYYVSLLVSAVILSSLYFSNWKQLAVFQLSMLIVLVQASMLTVVANVSIILFLGFYIVTNCIVFLIQLYIFNQRKKVRTLAYQLELTAKNLERSNKSLEQFAYVASHDLKEPLRTVNSYLGLIKKRYADKLDTDGNEFIALTTDATQRMHVLIEGLLKYSKVSSEYVEKQELNLKDVLNNVLDNLETSISENHVNVAIANLPVLVGDKLQLSQLFQNLISNAIKYRSLKDPEISIDSKIDDDHCLISVEDNGLGIPEKQKEAVFKIFNRYHTDKADGAGIGLAICKKIVSNHNGDIWVESKEGRGSKFYFTLQLN
ncbi:MAG: GHKL domain-containing protein [Fimbriimonadaceae bacterium]|nr:GHKL domain-containing protein [Chitinophagales bacterium]